MALPGRPVVDADADADAPSARVIRESNACAARRYRARARANARAMLSELESTRRERDALRVELAHARWVLDAVATRYGMRGGRRSGDGLGEDVIRVVAHGVGCPLRDGDAGPFRLDGGGDAATGGATRARRDGRGVGGEDDLEEFLREFLVHDPEQCPCPGHERGRGS